MSDRSDSYHLFGEELRKHKALEELKAMLADWKRYEKVNISEGVQIALDRTAELKEMVEKIMEILDENSK